MDSGLREGDWLIQVHEKGITSKDFNLVHTCWWSSDRVAFIQVMAFSAALSVRIQTRNLYTIRRESKELCTYAKAGCHWWNTWVQEAALDKDG